jgi:NAD+ synthase (glutamine-hydrolysing)
MNIVIAQLELRTGDLYGNTAKIINTVEESSDNSVIIFPELAVTGYNCGSLFESDDFINDALECVDQIVKATKGTNKTAIFGAPRFATPDREPNGNIRLHNSAMIARDGKLLAVYDKILLANDFQHEDRKYFIPGENLFTFQVGDQVAGVLICEDIWAPDHDRNLVAELKALNPDLSMIFCINYSYYTYEKHSARQNLLSNLARDHKVGIFYVNAVGVGDIVKNFMVYDGRSMVYDALGNLFDILPSFEEKIISCSLKKGKIFNWFDNDWDGIDKRNQRRFLYSKNDKYQTIWCALKYALRQLMDQTGIERAQVHVSGGIDSAVVAALCAKALGPDRCVFISNPSQYNGDITKNNAQYIADKLGVPLYWMPVGDLTNHAKSIFQNAYLESAEDGCRMPLASEELPQMVDTTLDAVGRTLLGLSICHYFKSAIISTGNHTENVLGWFTFHDVGSVGLFQPLGDLTKSEVNCLAKYINEIYEDEIIPINLYDGSTKPMAELADSSEDPFDYPLYSGICAEIIRRRMTVRDLEEAYDNHTLTTDYFCECDPYNYPKDVFVSAARDAWNRSKRSVFKCAQSSPTLIVSPRSRGFSSRETILNYYNS